MKLVARCLADPRQQRFAHSSASTWPPAVGRGRCQETWPANLELWRLNAGRVDGYLNKAIADAGGTGKPSHVSLWMVLRIDRRPSHWTITPDPEIWREAGVLSGTLARTQGYGREQRRRVLNDALLSPPLENTDVRYCLATFGTLTCCSNSTPRGKSCSIE